MSGPAAPTAAPAGRRSGERRLQWPGAAPPHVGDTVMVRSGEVLLVMSADGPEHAKHADVSVTPSPPCRACAAGSLSYDPPSGAWICRDCGAVTAVTDPR